MKRVLINGLLLNGKFSGVRHSIESLLLAMSEIAQTNIPIDVLVGQDYNGPLTSRNSLSVVPARVDPASRWKRILFENYSMPRYYRDNRMLAGYHSPGYILPVPSLPGSMVTIHDIIALQFPHLCESVNALYFSMMLPATIRKAQRIMTVSQQVKTDILERFPSVNPDRISVVYPGIGTQMRRIEDEATLRVVRAKYMLPESFFLFVGNIEPKKNLKRLIQAMHRLRTDFQRPQKLVIVGRKSWGYADVEKYVTSHGMADDVIIIGHVPDNDLPVLYTLADVFVFPSLYEGFGLPPLEAMACGTPVVVSNRGALPEVTGGHCYYVDPEDVSDIASTLARVTESDEQKQKYMADALRWSRQFTWHATAIRTIEEYQSVLSKA